MLRNQETNTAAESPATDAKDTKSEVATTTVVKKEPASSTETPPSNTLAMVLMWLPLAVAMGLWLYLRGRNQAAMRAREEALTLAAKKAKKSSRSQQVVKPDDAAQHSVQSTNPSGSASKSKSKKSKKDKSKKKQPAISDATSSKAKQTVAAIAASPAAAAASSLPTSSNTESAPSPAAPIVSAPPVNKAIFEPLRKVTAPVAKSLNVESDDEQTTEQAASGQSDSDESYSRKRRPIQPPAPVVTPTKVSSGRFEKLNTSAATIGIGATNRWPVEASQPVAPVRAVQNTESQTKRESAKRAPAAPMTGRGLGAFVKTAKPSADSPADSPSDSNAVSQVVNSDAANSSDASNGL